MRTAIIEESVTVKEVENSELPRLLLVSSGLPKINKLLTL